MDAAAQMYARACEEALRRSAEDDEPPTSSGNLEQDREECRAIVLHADAYFQALAAKGFKPYAGAAQPVVDAIIRVTSEMAAAYRQQKVDTNR
jgi:hypothetical protein